MRTRKLQTLVLILIIMMSMNVKKSYSTIINVGVANFQFSPANINATVGDTIKWNWMNGSHTTTCDGTNGTSRPSGASQWNSGMNSGTPVFTYVLTAAGSYHYVCLPHSPDMAGNINATISSITQVTELALSYGLSQNYPNPFNPSTSIKFSVPNSSSVTLKIFNTNGQEVQTLVNENLNAGSYKVDWNAVNFPSGVYYYKLQSEGFIQTRKMLLIK